jgi:hypothetical protein
MTKRVRYLTAVFLSFFLIGVSANADEIDVKTGLWHWSMTMNMAGMKMPPVKYTSVVTKEDLVPQQSNPNQQCKMLENRFEDDTVIWVVECRSEVGLSTSKGKIKYTKTTAEGEIVVITQDMSMKSIIKGHHASVNRQ